MGWEHDHVLFQRVAVFILCRGHCSFNKPGLLQIAMVGSGEMAQWVRVLALQA